MAEFVNQNAQRVAIGAVYNGAIHNCTVDANGRLLTSPDSSGGGSSPADSITRAKHTTSGTPGTQTQAAGLPGNRIRLHSPDTDDPNSDFVANTGQVFVGISGGVFETLWPGDSIVMEIENANLLYFTSNAASQTVLISAEVVS